MKDTRFIHLSWAAAFTVVGVFGSAAWVGVERQAAVLRMGELAIEHTEKWAELCEAYANWRGHQNYSGPDALNGRCATDPATYAEAEE